MTTSISLRIKLAEDIGSKIRLISMSAWLQATGYDHFDISPYMIKPQLLDAQQLNSK